MPRVWLKLTFQTRISPYSSCSSSYLFDGRNKAIDWSKAPFWLNLLSIIYFPEAIKEKVNMSNANMHVASVRANKKQWLVCYYFLTKRHSGIIGNCYLILSTTSINIHLDLLFNYEILIKQMKYQTHLHYWLYIYLCIAEQFLPSVSVILANSKHDVYIYRPTWSISSLIPTSPYLNFNFYLHF